MSTSRTPSGLAEPEAQEAALPGNTTVIVKGPMLGHSPDDRAHYLVVAEGEGAGLRIELGGKAIVIGRMEPAEIVLPDDQISRKHCRVSMILEDVFVADLGSSNGTYVDGKRIAGNAFLPVGARLRVGNTTLQHEWRARREVRASNEPAKALYARFGFAPAGIRKNYYAEVGEDALIMWAHDIDGDAYADRLAAIEADLPPADVRAA